MYLLTTIVYLASVYVLYTSLYNKRNDMARPLVATRVDPEAFRRLKELSGKQGWSVAWLARKAIEIFLDSAGGERTPERKGA